jgi:hypothetical protein
VSRDGGHTVQAFFSAIGPSRTAVRPGPERGTDYREAAQPSANPPQAVTAKPIVLLLEEGHAYAFLVRGLHTVADVNCLNFAGSARCLRPARTPARRPRNG